MILISYEYDEGSLTIDFSKVPSLLMTKTLLFILVLFFAACGEKSELIKPSISDITESVYASGNIKSKDQYLVYTTVSGIIKNVSVSEGDTVSLGSTIITIDSKTQELAKENAELNAQYQSFFANKDKLNDAQLQIRLAKSKMQNDSALYFRQKALWQQLIGTKVEFELKELSYQNSKTAYASAQLKYDELNRQLQFNSNQSKKNAMISNSQVSDFTVRSEIKGRVYSLLKSKGELVSLQTPIAMIGSRDQFILEMQVDEYDIFKVEVGKKVLVNLDSYKGKVFEAQISKIYPIMNERSKTFLVEAEFIDVPEVLYPNITFEANIIIRTKKNALLIPRNCLVNDSAVIRSNGDTAKVKTGLKDYKKVEILSGISPNEALRMPIK
jgi:HlyD family secretion protein